MQPLQLTYKVSPDRSKVQVTRHGIPKADRTGQLYGNCTHDSLKSGKQQIELHYGVLFQARVVVHTVKSKFYGSSNQVVVINQWVYVMFNKRNPEDHTCKIKLTCPKLNIVNEMCFTNENINDAWQLVAGINGDTLNFEFHFTFEKINSVSWCSPLFEDSELTDFEVVGSDGGVHFHRAVLAAASPVLRRMLAADWKEAREGQLHRPDISRATLQAFKQYLYLRRLPDTGLDQLMLLAVYYDIPEMEKACVNEIKTKLTAETALEHLEFALENKVKRLACVILKQVKIDAIKLKDIMEYVGISTNME